MSVVAPPPNEAHQRSPFRSLNPLSTAVLLLAAALAAWIVAINRMQGMDTGPGTDLGDLAWYLGIWVTMMAAMMLPSVAPMVLLYARVSRERHRRGRASFIPTWVFLAGYLGAWTAYGLLAYGIFRLVTAADPGFLAWDEAGPYVAGGAIAAAGLYQLTPLKEVCLRHCRGPVHFILHGWREGRIGALRMGAEHGLYCVGCCWGLMIVLVPLGVMNLAAMAGLAAVIFLEKLWRWGPWLTWAVGIAFLVLAVIAPFQDGLLPGLQMSGPSM